MAALAAAAVLAAGVQLPAAAQPYPARPVKMIVPFAAGSGSDIVARILADELRKGMNQSFLVENKPGASAQIAAEAVAKSAPDGYTLFVTTNTANSANPWLFKKINYDPIKDFTPVARVTYHPYVLIVRPDSGIASVRDLVEKARANPGKMNYGYGSSTSQVAGAAFVHRAGLDVTAVPYKSMPGVLTDVIGGRLDFVFADLTSIHGHVQAGQLKPIAFTLLQRASQLPGVPTVAETPGFEGYEVTSWIGIVGPANLPRDIVQRLNAEVNRILQRPEIRTRLAELGGETAPGTPDEFSAFMRQQLESWRVKIQAAGIQPE
jgi:tripartite-type tricarboxylate transporter receptor subunit TctC